MLLGLAGLGNDFGEVVLQRDPDVARAIGLLRHGSTFLREYCPHAAVIPAGVVSIGAGPQRPARKEIGFLVRGCNRPDGGATVTLYKSAGDHSVQVR